MKNKEINDIYNEIRTKYYDMELVFPISVENPQVILIGEAPGREELKQGKPFVGAAGKNLNEFLQTVNINRSDIYITNVFKYGLRKVNPKSGKLINRPAKKEEIIEASYYLKKEIGFLKPSIVVTLGNTALWAVTGDFEKKVGEMHGHIIELLVNNEKKELFAMYHPASIIYNRSLKEEYIRDMQKLKELCMSLDKFSSH